MTACTTLLSFDDTLSLTLTEKNFPFFFVASLLPLLFERRDLPSVPQFQQEFLKYDPPLQCPLPLLGSLSQARKPLVPLMGSPFFKTVQPSSEVCWQLPLLLIGVSRGPFPFPKRTFARVKSSKSPSSSKFSGDKSPFLPEPFRCCQNSFLFSFGIFFTEG